jgi:type II pantothenate kinase
MDSRLDNASLGEHSGQATQARDILLPSPTSNKITHISLDIGGTLCKLIYYTKSDMGGGRLNFTKFETRNITECIQFISKLHSKSPISYISATGGGAFKYTSLLLDSLPGVALVREDEMACLIRGLSFFVTQITDTVFTYVCNTLLIVRI